MARKDKAKAKAATAAKPTKPVTAKKVKAPKAEKAKARSQRRLKRRRTRVPSAVVEKAQLISSVTVYQGPLFRIQHDKLIEPDGLKSERDVIRHNGSVVILAMDTSKSKKNPWIVIERQYRHAATSTFGAAGGEAGCG